MMYTTISSVGHGSETGIRAQNGDVLLRQRAQERLRLGGLDGGESQGGDNGQYVPSRYMVLISRVDRAHRQGRVESPMVDQLTSLLGERLAGLTPGARRVLAELPEMQALGVDNVLQLPRVIASHLHAGTEHEAVMNLLRSPGFAAAIKDQSRTTTYGPRGMLRAS